MTLTTCNSTSSTPMKAKIHSFSSFSSREYNKPIHKLTMNRGQGEKMTFVKLPVVPLYWHFPRTIKGYKRIFAGAIYTISRQRIHQSNHDNEHTLCCLRSLATLEYTTHNTKHQSNTETPRRKRDQVQKKRQASKVFLLRLFFFFGSVGFTLVDPLGQDCILFGCNFLFDIGG